MTTPLTDTEPQQPASATLQRALERIAARAAMMDREQRFPSENFTDLQRAGALERPAGGFAAEVALVRAIAAVDASTARIYDGHLNGLERLALAAPPALDHELKRVRSEGLLLGVWGADPARGEGEPARLEAADGGGWWLDGVKTFCSGAGGVQRALVVAGGERGERRLVYVDATDSRLEVDCSWYRASGLRSSESHRVVFHRVPVLAVLGDAGELSREPYFSRDAIRTTGTWVGLIDAIVRETVAAAGAPGATLSETQAHALGRMRVAATGVDLWLGHAVKLLSAATAPETALSAALQARIAISESAREIAGLAAEILGSRALIGASNLDRARRDLDLFLLQHRLAKKVVALGQDLIQRGDS